MSGLTLAAAPALGLLLLALHLAAVAFATALRTYSRSRLEEVCLGRGHPERADTIAHQDERTERSAEALVVLTGLALAALLGLAIERLETVPADEVLLAVALVLGGLGHLATRIVGRVYAEAVLDALWPASGALRGLMAPLTATARGLEALIYLGARSAATAPPRPASVEVELPTTFDDEDEVLEADLPEATREMLENVLELARRDVSEVMTPRSMILALPATTSARAAARAFIDSGRSRIPLFGENRDDIVGILYAKDLFARLVDGGEAAAVPRKLARPALFVPETKNATELLEEFRTQRLQMAIVLDEYGGVTGVVTLEDLIEEVVGPIDDEHDVPTPPDAVVELGGARFEVEGTLALEDLNERLGLRLPTGGDFQTIGGFAFHALGHLPDPGASFRHEGIEFTVLEVGDHSIRRIRLDLQPAAAVGSQ